MATKRNIIIDQGSTYSEDFAVPNTFTYDGTYLARGKFRKWYGSNTGYSFTANLASNVVTISYPASNSAAREPGRYFYDIEIYTGNTISYRIFEGMLTITPEMTK